MLYDGKYGPVEPGTFRDYVRRSIFLKRQQAETMKHLSMMHAMTQNTEKANKTLTSYMTLAMPFLYDEVVDNNMEMKAMDIMKQYEGKVIQFSKLEGTGTNAMGDPYELTSVEDMNKVIEQQRVPEELIANREPQTPKKDKLAINRK